MSWLTYPVTHYAFFRHGLAAGVMGGALCGLIGVYVVLRRMSYIGHGLSHAIFGGAVVSYVVQVNFFIGAGLWGLLSALIINAVARSRKIGADAAIGIVTTAAFAFGVALISAVTGFTINFEAALFGNILGVTLTQLAVLAGVSVITVGIVLLRYRQLLFLTFDPDVADAYGMSVRRMDALFALILAATVVSTMQILGVTLIAATIVIPAVIARLLTDSFRRMLVLATLLGALCGAVGMYVSFYTNVASGAAIVLTMAGVFVLVYAATALISRRRLQRLAPAGQNHTDELSGPVSVHIG